METRFHIRFGFVRYIILLIYPYVDIKHRSRNTNEGFRNWRNGFGQPCHRNGKMIRSGDFSDGGIEPLSTGTRQVHFGPGMG
jgi:hypothetical protein